MKCLINSLFLFFLFFFNQTPEYEIYSTAIIQRFYKEILEPNNMTISSIGGSSDKGIKMIHLGINAHGIGNVDKSRKMLVNLVEQLLRLYNENEKIRPFLLNYPFDSSNLEFEISFVNENNRFWILDERKNPIEQITYVTLDSGDVCYNIHTGGKIAPLQTVFRESYQDALKIVQDEKKRLREVQLLRRLLAVNAVQLSLLTWITNS